MPIISVPAEAYPLDLPLEKTALLVIDMQNDFCAYGGYGDLMGYDITMTRRPIEPIQKVLAAVRETPITVIHTREGHRPDLSDCPPNKIERSRRVGAGIGDPGPMGRILVRGEKGHAIIDELQPVAGEIVLDKPGKGSFYQTDLDLILRNRGISHLLFSGVTTDVCVHTTMRVANDIGYYCLLLEDCCGAFDQGNHQAAINMVKMQGGVFGWVSNSQKLCSALVGATATV
ncbi:cysteine hydrolase [Leptolyngbya sp. FACHB-261]|nr:isochorismatase family cysteine hydrolase [Leptolyngbya sp. FACHB-261]MBD2099641.1 cysteine hydrolase [Leptolyngbya sp. FACHB-261]